MSHLDLTGPISSLVNSITSELSANWPTIAAVLGAVLGIGTLLLFIERHLRVEHDFSLWLDEDELADWREDEALLDHLALLDAFDALDVEEINETLVAMDSVWHVGSWDVLDDEPGWRWLGQDDELAEEAEGDEEDRWDGTVRWDTSESIGPPV